MVQVNAHNGRPTSSSDPDAIWEAFLAGTEPDNNYVPPSYKAGTTEINEPLPAEEMLTPNPDATPSSVTEGTGGVY
jgi:hypothetical protein